MGTRIGFVASEKGAGKECDVGLGLRMQTNDNKSFSRRKKMMMMMMPHHDDEPSLLNKGFGDEGYGLGGGGTSGDRENDSGPNLFCNTSNNINNNQVASMADIYDVVGSDSGSLLPRTLLLPNSENFSYNSSGVMVNANVRVPFTDAQRQELERQTMIYKYMTGLAPVPPQLLVPITKTPSNFAHLHSTRSLELGISNSSNPEPWRCKRTDGKKWRCSRNVVPDQKYCERHSHKSRPRSRKHVELHSQLFNNNNNNNNNNNTRIPYSKPDFLDQRKNHHQSPLSSNVVSSSTNAASHDQPRSMEWFVNSNQEWQQMVHAKQNESNTNVDVSKQTNDIALNLYNNHGLQQSQGLNDQFSLMLDPKLTSLGGGAMDSNHTNQTRHFIDAWSTAERDHLAEIGHSRYTVSSNEKLPFSSLALSIHGGNETSEENQNAQLGFGPFMSSGRESEGDGKSQWMMNPVSWSGSPPPGGPLAEALCLGMAGSTRPAPSRSSS